MIRNRITTDNLGSVMQVVDLIEVGELLCGEELLFEGEEDRLGLLGDLVGEVEVAGTGQAGLRAEG